MDKVLTGSDVYSVSANSARAVQYQISTCTRFQRGRSLSLNTAIDGDFTCIQVNITTFSNSITIYYNGSLFIDQSNIATCLQKVGH